LKNFAKKYLDPETNAKWENKPAFDVFVHHQDSVHTLPSDAVLLGSSPLTKVEMFYIENQVFATQGHPELDYIESMSLLQYDLDSGRVRDEMVRPEMEKLSDIKHDNNLMKACFTQFIVHDLVLRDDGGDVDDEKIEQPQKIKEHVETGVNTTKGESHESESDDSKSETEAKTAKTKRGRKRSLDQCYDDDLQNEMKPAKRIKIQS
jgi:hypothetical protein